MYDLPYKEIEQKVLKLNNLCKISDAQTYVNKCLKIICPVKL